MKKYIKASVGPFSSGAYLVDRQGNIEQVNLHVPSTTWVERGYKWLSPVDAEFLLKHNLISENDAMCILTWNFAKFLQEDKGTTSYSMMDTSKFIQWAELRYAPKLKNIFMGNFMLPGSVESDDAEFGELTDKWYSYLLNEYVKMSVIGNSIEFRINSEDGFDWNEIIIDHVLLPNSDAFNSSVKINIVRESSKGYQVYFMGASLNDILENDKMVLSSQIVQRKIINDEFMYS